MIGPLSLLLFLMAAVFYVSDRTKQKKHIQPRDENDVCPCCGHRRGKLKSVLTDKNEAMLQHECLVCFAKWNEAPVIGKANSALIRPYEDQRPRMTITDR